MSQATGKPHTLWVSFAKFYDENDVRTQSLTRSLNALTACVHHSILNFICLQSIEDARVIMEKATLVNYKTVEDLAALW